MIPASFEYVRADSLDEALAALADPEAKALAGGHSLLPALKLRIVRPTLLVDIGRLDLRGVTAGREAVTIRALTTYDELERLDGSVPLPDALRECAAAVGDLQVRNAGTIGGGLAHGDPASDAAAAALALGVTLRLSSPGGTRDCPADEFFLGPFTTALQQQELLTDVVVPVTGPGEGSAYVAVEDPASGYALAGAAVLIRLGAGGSAPIRCRVGLTGVGGRPFRAAAVEAALLHGGAGIAAVREALGELEVGTRDADYRHQLAAVVIWRSYEQARARAETGGAA